MLTSPPLGPRWFIRLTSSVTLDGKLLKEEDETVAKVYPAFEWQTTGFEWQTTGLRMVHQVLLKFSS